MQHSRLRTLALIAVFIFIFSLSLPAAAQPLANQPAAALPAAASSLKPVAITPLRLQENDPTACSSGAHTLSKFGDRVYPEMGNGGYTSLHSDIYIVYDAPTNMFLPGTHVDLTQQASQCLTDFSLDFEQTSADVTGGPNLAVSSVLVDGQPAVFTFVQPTYPGDPNGQDDPDPLAHAVSNVNPVSATNPNPPACSPQVSGNAQNGAQCPANKLVITPASPIPNGATYVVTVNYTGRPGYYNDGDGTTEGWFRSNSPAGDGAFVTTEPVGTMAWMPLNNHPSAKATVDVYDTVNPDKTAISAGVLVSNDANAPDDNFPGGSVTWHWQSIEPIASYLLTNSIGSFDLTQQTLNGIQYYWAVPSSISATLKTNDKVVTDQQPTITQFQSRFSGPFPFTSNGVIIGLPSASFAEEMQTKITFPNGARSTPSVGTLAHENMHQWFGDNVSEAAFNLTFWKEGWATIGEYLNTARTAAINAGGLDTPTGNAAFDTSLINRFNTNYGTTSASFWTGAPSNPTVSTLFTTSSTYTRPGTAYLALRQILDSSLSRPASDRWIGVMKQIQTQYGGGTINEAQLEAVFHQWLPNQSPACHAKLDTFFAQWFDTAYPTPNNATNKPQITGPGINGPDHFYDDAGECTRADQSITFGALGDQFTDAADFTLSATADSGLAVVFSASGECSVSGASVHLTGTAGSCSITAAQAGDGVFKPATPVEQTFAVNQHAQTITFAAIPDHTYLDADIELAASASSGLPVAYSAAGNCSVDSGIVHITGAGACTITASQAGSSNFSAAEDVSQSFIIAKASQAITLPALADLTFGAADFDPGATASSSLPVAYTAAGSCTVESGLVHLTAAGSCTVTAIQAGDANYSPAADVAASFTIATAPTQLDLSASPASVQYSDVTLLKAAITPFNIAGNLLSGSVAFSVNGAPVGSAALDASGVASLPLMVTYTPGSYSLTATFTSTNTSYTGSSGAPFTFAVTAEDARATYNGSSLFWTSSLKSTSANVTLSAAIQDITAVDPATDNKPGDIRKARVTFINRDTNIAIPGCANLTIGLVSAGNTTTGSVKCATTLSSGSTGAAQYTVGVVVSGYYERDASEEDVIITIAQPITADFITGGGNLVLRNSAGLVPGSTGSKAYFGFTLKYTRGGKNLQGNVNVIVRNGSRVYLIKATSFASMSINGSKANFTGKATIWDITNPWHITSVDNSATLQLWLTDNGEPGSGDTLGIQVLNKSGSLWFSSSWNGVKTVEQKLDGGNLLVR
jgi:hypothetical protein